MARLINAETLVYVETHRAKYTDKPEVADAYRQVLWDIAHCETIDAVPVVRCKDCKNRGTPYSCPMRKLVMPFQGAGSYEDCTEDDGYCHMGVKKDLDKTEE